MTFNKTQNLAICDVQSNTSPSINYWKKFLMKILTLNVRLHTAVMVYDSQMIKLIKNINYYKKIHSIYPMDESELLGILQTLKQIQLL